MGLSSNEKFERVHRALMAQELQVQKLREAIQAAQNEVVYLSGELPKLVAKLDDIDVRLQTLPEPKWWTRWLFQ